jgi:hypothetical protein
MAMTALSIAAAWRKVDRTAAFGGGRKYVVIGKHLVLEMLQGMVIAVQSDERTDLNIAFKNQMSYAR